MAQSLSQILLHVIFSTKDREPTIPDELTDELYQEFVEFLHRYGVDYDERYVWS